LIFHQGDERRHDHRKTSAHDGRKLETQRFPSAGRQEGEDITARNACLDNFALQGAEFPVTERLLERGGQQISPGAGDSR